MDHFISATEQYIRAHGLLQKGDRLIVGVSGGADSVCLLEVLLALKEKWQWDITVVHVNHGIRGESADADEAFVRDLCKDRGVRCHVYLENVPAMAKEEGLSVEEAGRLVRRGAFERELESAPVNGRIVLAHHADDNAETFLMNVSRGTGIEGLGGIRPEAGSYVRPLLWAGRDEIEAFLGRRNLAYCEDESNEDESYTRNLIRHQVMPLLTEHVNSRAAEHIGSAMQEIRELTAYLERETDRLMALYVKQEEGQWVLDAKAAQEEPYLVSCLIKKCLIGAAGCAKDIGRTHITAVEDLLAGQTGREASLPYGLTAVREYGRVVMRTESAKSGESTSPFRAESRFVDELGALDDPYTKYFDYGIITDRSVFRTRQPGDYIVIDAAGHRQKVGDWMTDHKIPHEKRDEIRLLADGKHVYWIAGYRQSEDSLVTEDTETIIEWKVKEHESCKSPHTDFGGRASEKNQGGCRGD